MKSSVKRSVLKKDVWKMALTIRVVSHLKTICNFIQNDLKGDERHPLYYLPLDTTIPPANPRTFPFSGVFERENRLLKVRALAPAKIRADNFTQRDKAGIFNARRQPFCVELPSAVRFAVADVENRLAIFQNQDAGVDCGVG